MDEEEHGRFTTGETEEEQHNKLPPWGKKLLTKREMLGREISQELLSRNKKERKGGERRGVAGGRSSLPLPYKNPKRKKGCYETEQKLEERERHPINHRDRHMLYQVEINDVPQDTKDKDEILESEFFDTRQAFLSLCQGNHYQYDTLRRAKHSSMMVLYHLHNPTAPAFVTTCYICHLDIETGQGWRCEICPDYDVCNSCYEKDEGIDHPHKLTNHPSMADCDAQNKEARQLRVSEDHDQPVALATFGLLNWMECEPEHHRNHR
ncbi:hypothetical protein TEA_014266 [Camellia sinensis var. sinensis]|uniref:histone acetyltransferase n=1 Tax=Camellia sinensis var. sinensis TaxID=542762 RepID=A0A4S4D7M0_CAMSN|nr:hypothetical protein TEA_014266 [Camellia sinensis var. sinensis]